MEGLLDIDRILYGSCRDYADRLIRQKLTAAAISTCGGCAGIRELCDKCPYFEFSEMDYIK